MSASNERFLRRMVRELAHEPKTRRPLPPAVPVKLAVKVEDSGAYEEICWELTASRTGATAGLAAYSKRHLVRKDAGLRSTRPICGVQPGYTVGNFGSTDQGRCGRCYRAALKELGLA
jgi:hypothetical protein